MINPVKDLVIYSLDSFSSSTLNDKELGQLVYLFHKKFYFWNLLIQRHVCKYDKDLYRLYVVYGETRRKDNIVLSEKELEQMRAFVAGYEAAVVENRKKS